MADHALLSASSSHRWLVCGPSARLEEPYPDVETEYTKEGTLAHKLAEFKTRFKLGWISDTCLAREMEIIKADPLYSDEMLEYAEAYAGHISATLEDMERSDGDVFIELEHKVDYSMYAPGGFGTCDCLMIGDSKLVVIDLKYGKRRIEAEGNTQMRLYALGADCGEGTSYFYDNIEMIIFQPRIEDGISISRVTRSALCAWGQEYVIPRAENAFRGCGEFAPSEQACYYCKARHECRARAKQYVDMFDDTPDPALLSLDEVGDYLQRSQGFARWLGDLETLATKSLIEGSPVQGWKLVEGRSNRKITKPDEAAAILAKEGLSETQIFDYSIKGITALEKLVGKKKFAVLLADCIEKPAGGPKLVPSADPRDEYRPDAALLDMFNIEVEEN